MVSLFEQEKKCQQNQSLITEEKGHPTIAGKVQDIFK